VLTVAAGSVAWMNATGGSGGAGPGDLLYLSRNAI